MSRILVYLSDREITALRAIAEREYRDLRSQVAFIVRAELQRQGLLNEKPEIELNTQEGVTNGTIR